MEKQRVKDDAFQREAISLTPLAIPMLARPGAIGLYEQYELISQKIVIITAILPVCIATFYMLRCSNSIVSLLGASGINAFSG